MGTTAKYIAMAATGALLGLMFALSAAAATNHDNLKKGLALQGYDPVSYFTENRAREGDKNLTAEHNGATYRFASSANRTKFRESPDTYLPAYGGWCATAMAEGDKVKIDPENFVVTDGRLFLFYKGLLGNAKKDWDKDAANLERKADAAWASLTRR